MSPWSQGFSSIAAHISGMAWSRAIARGSEGLSECSWYGIVFSVDTILGVALSLTMHRGATTNTWGHCAAAIRGSPLVWREVRLTRLLERA